MTTMDIFHLILFSGNTFSIFIYSSAHEVFQISEFDFTINITVDSVQPYTKKEKKTHRKLQIS